VSVPAAGVVSTAFASPSVQPPAPAKTFSFDKFVAAEPDANPKPVPGSKLPAAAQPTPAQPLPPASAQPPAAVAAGPVDLGVLWQQLIDAVGRVSPFTRGYLIDAHPVSFVKGTLVIGFDPEFEDHLGLVDNSRNHTLLATKLSELGHPNAMIKFIKADAPADWQRPVLAPVASPAPKAAPMGPKSSAAAATAAAPATEKKSAPISLNKEEFKNDPLIQKALDVFKGTIVEVRA
jgi:hypothetical protein